MEAPEPQFARHKEIDADVLDVEVAVVNEYGFADIGSEYENHLVAWAEFKSGAPLRTTTIQGDTGDVRQTFVQRSDGNVNIGPQDEVSGKRVVLLILDEERE